MRYTETKAYQDIVSDLNSGIESLTKELSNLIDLKKRSKEEQRSIASLKERIKTKQKRLEKVFRLDVDSHSLLLILFEAEGTLWSDHEAATWNEQIESPEGRGEKALRMRYGLPIVVTSGTCDLPEVNEEVKSLQSKRLNKNGKFRIQSIQTCKSGRYAYGPWLMTSAEDGKFKGLPDDLRERISVGELTKKNISRLPSDIIESANDKFSASKVIGMYDAINGTTQLGFIRIPKSDCDDAWQLDRVARMGPSYSLRKEYIVKRLLKTLDSPIDNVIL